jgi:hypothetical protein
MIKWKTVELNEDVATWRQIKATGRVSDCDLLQDNAGLCLTEN